MHRATRIPLVVGCACLASCAEQRLECGTDAVTGTLSSMVRDRVLRVAADGYPASFDAAKRAALARATRVTPRATKLIEWDKGTGRLMCVARIVVDAPGPAIDTNLRREAELHYRVTFDAADTFFVEVAFAEMMTRFPMHAEGAPETKAAP